MSHELVGILSRKQCGGAIRKHLLKTLADRANNDGTGIFCSVKTLARDAEVAERTVQNHLRAFEREGLLRNMGRRPCKHGYTINYRISLRAVHALNDIKRPEIEELLNECIESTGEAPAPVQTDTGAANAPVQDVAERVQEMHPTGAGDAPLPVQEMHPNQSLEPILEPVVAEVARASVSKAMILEAQSRAGDAINLTSGNVHHGGVLRQLLDAGCEWQDILDAIDAIAASLRSRGKQFHSWAIIRDTALDMRNRRTNPPPEPNHGIHSPRAASDHGNGARASARPQARSAATIIMERAIADERDERKVLPRGN